MINEFYYYWFFIIPNQNQDVMSGVWMSYFFRNIQQVKRTILAKEISDHAFLSCTPTSALRRDQLSIHTFNTGATNTSSVSTQRMRSYRCLWLLIFSTTHVVDVRWVLFSTCTLFLVTWLPWLTCSLFTDSQFLHGELQTWCDSSASVKNIIGSDIADWVSYWQNAVWFS